MERIPCRTVIWAAGVAASPLGKALGKSSGAKLDRAGRLEVEPDLTVAGHPEIFVIGDLANYPHQTGKPLPGIAPVAMQQGRYVARVIGARFRNTSIAPFYYRDRGAMAIIGRASAVADRAGCASPVTWPGLPGYSFIWSTWSNSKIKSSCWSSGAGTISVAIGRLG